MTPKEENIRAKKILLKMRDFIQLVDEGKERYMIAEVMTRFGKLPTRFQKAFIEFFSEEIPNEHWTKCLEDETLYISAIRSIAMYYTGMEKITGVETTLGAFKNQIADFMKSDYYKKARVTLMTKKKKSFADRLATL